MHQEVLELFQMSAEEKTAHEIAKIKDELGNVRRGIFSRHTDLYRSIEELYEIVEGMNDKIDNLDKEVHESTNAISFS